MSHLDSQANRPDLIWSNNSVLVQLLGLSPVLAVSSSLTYGIALGTATLLVCVLSCLTASLMKNIITAQWRLVYFMLILASYTTVLDSLMQFAYYPLYLKLGHYIPLLCCNVAIVLRMEKVALKSNWLVTSADALKTGIGFLLAIILVSACRELIASGTFFKDWQLLLSAGKNLSLQESNAADSYQFTFANTQAGAPILLGLLIALINFISSLSRNIRSPKQLEIVPAKRARVTGRIARDSSKD
jgi:Na+-translocating ferredoxin:NAD+ oxidoreductase subunit E